jgi:SET domain-containing protein
MQTKTESSIEAPESDYLYVTDSQLPNSGKGLRTAITIYKDEIISIFKGEILTNEEANKRALNNKDQYFISMLDGTIMDSRNTECFAKYANDASAFESKLFKNNAKIGLTENQEVCLIATRKIKPGEEIFCSYGKRYWGKHG